MWRSAADRRDKMKANKFQPYFGVLIGILLCAVAFAGLKWCPNPVGHSFSEALFIAGVLTIAVDPFLKRRLVKEATEDIFHHLLGFDLPVEIRETLRDFLFNNRSYRKNVEIDATAKTLDHERVEVTWSMRSDLIALAAIEYQQHISFEAAEHGSLLEASVTSSSHPERNYDLRNFVLTRVKDELSVREWSGRKCRLKKSEELRTFIKFTTQGPKVGFSFINFERSTINPKVRVYAGADLDVTASAPDELNGCEYIYKKVFVAGDHIQVRWQPKAEVATHSQVPQP
jgi:hypothetical protein